MARGNAVGSSTEVESATFEPCEHAEIYRDYVETYESLVVPFFDESLE